MTVEHRCGQRHGLEMTVTLRSRARGPRQFRVRNISSGGMFIEMDHSQPAPCTVFEIALAKAEGQVTHMYIWRAMVVHRQADGIGLMFDRFRGDEIAALLRRVDHRLPPAPLERPRAAG